MVQQGLAHEHKIARCSVLPQRHVHLLATRACSLLLGRPYLLTPTVRASDLTLPACRQLANTLEKLGINYWYKEPVKTADKAASNHGISAMKFQLIRVRDGLRQESAHWATGIKSCDCNTGTSHAASRHPSSQEIASCRGSGFASVEHRSGHLLSDKVFFKRCHRVPARQSKQGI